MWGFEVSPPLMMWAILVESWELVSQDLKCLLPFMSVWLFSWDMKCLPPFMDVWLFSYSGTSFHMSDPMVVVEVLSINSSHVIMKHSGRS